MSDKEHFTFLRMKERVIRQSIWIISLWRSWYMINQTSSCEKLFNKIFKLTSLTKFKI